MLGGIIQSVVNAKSISDIFTAPVSMFANGEELSRDTASLIHLNGCTSPQLLHFQKNLLQFALGKPGIRPDGTPMRYVAMDDTASGGTLKDSDYIRLVADMVEDQSKTWALNRYVEGSVSNVVVRSRDALGRPAAISATYSYSGMSGDHALGSVKLTFSDGMPECLYYSDLPSNCVTPSHKLTASYRNGEYRK